MASLRSGRTLNQKRITRHSPNDTETSASDITAWRFLGLVLPRSSNGILRVRPVFRWEDKWHPISNWAAKSLPQWKNAPEEAREGTLWAFSLDEEQPDSCTDSHSSLPFATEAATEQPLDVQEQTQADYKASLSVRCDGDEPIFAYEVIKQESAQELASERSGDEHTLLDEIEAVRQRYLLDGMESAPLGPVLADVKGKCVVGPLTLSRHEDGRWRAESLIAPIRAPFPQKSFTTLDMEGGKRKVRLASEDLPAITSEADFRADNFVIEEALRELTHSDSELKIDSAYSAQDFLSNLTSPVADIRPKMASRTAEAYRIKRLELALLRISAEQSRMKRWREVILSTPEARDVVELACREAEKLTVDSLSETVRETQERLKAEQCTLDALQRDIAQKQERLKKIDDAIHQANSTLTETMDARIVTISSKIAAELTERIALQFDQPQAHPRETIIAARQQDAPRSIPVIPIVTKWRASVARDEIPALPEACERLKRKFASTDSPSRFAESLLAAWMSDLIPVIISPDGLSIIRRVARCLTANRCLIVPTANAASLADLFGRVHSAKPSYVPSPTGLSDILLTMSLGDFEDKMGIVAFADVNLVETVSVFHPLSESYRTAWESPNDALLPLVHPVAIEDTDPYLPLAHAAWPKTLLPVFTWAQGASPLPPPSAFWQMTALIIAPSTADASNVKQIYEIRAPAWEQGREAVHRHTSSNAEKTFTAGDRRLMDALLSLDVSLEETRRLIFLSRRLPALLSEGRDPSNEEIPDGTPQDAIEAIRRALIYGS